jgi:hypothetical protein
MDTLHHGEERVCLTTATHPDRARVTHDSIEVDEDRRAVSDALVVEIHTELRGHGAARLKVRQELERDATQIPRPVGVTVTSVDRETDADGIRLVRKPAYQRVQRRNFRASSGGPVERIEEKEDLVTATVVGEMESCAELRLEREVGAGGADGDHDGHDAAWDSG